MSDFLPFRPLTPIVWPKAIAELGVLFRWQERAEAALTVAEIPKIWADHYASIADYWDHKRRHPDTPAGAMTVLYSWAKYIPVATAVVTLNPIVIAVAVIDAHRRSIGKPPFRQQIYDQVVTRVIFR